LKWGDVDNDEIITDLSVNMNDSKVI